MIITPRKQLIVMIGMKGKLKPDEIVTISLPGGKHPVQKHREQGVDAFLEEIRAAVKKYPEATTCCN